MKIAVASEDGYVSLHFGHCQEFSVFEVKDGSVLFSTKIPNPGHEPGVLPPFLAKHGVSCIIAGGIGNRAIELFKENNIEVVVGALGKVEEVLEKFLEGSLKTADSTCTHTE